MLDHARSWCDALGADPGKPEPTPDPTGRPGELAEALGKAVAAIEANEAMQTEAQARVEAARTERKQTKAAQAAHARQAVGPAAWAGHRHSLRGPRP